MHLKRLELHGFKSFAKKSEFVFDVPIIAVVGPNGSGKSNVVESIRFVLGEQSVKSMRGKTGSDLIFKGSREISKMSRAGVTIVFDNTDRVFHLHQSNNEKVNVDFDEVAISREVYSDGTNKYMINGYEVRMKDIHELIGSVNIGASGHHIISQGEADRYLNSSVKDRRELIEEALGLKIYQYRIKESQRKLKKSQENMRESELLRRELAPHLRFLKKQVDKIEKAKHLRTDLAEKYQTYFAQEDYLINQLSQKLDQDRNVVGEEYRQVQAFLESHGDPSVGKVYPAENQIAEQRQVISGYDRQISEIRQKLGRIEGMITMLEKQQQAPKSTEKKPPQVFAYTAVAHLISNVTQQIKSIIGSDTSTITARLDDIVDQLQSFIQQPTVATIPQVDNSAEILGLDQERKSLHLQLSDVEQKQQLVRTEIERLLMSLQQQQAEDREKERQYYEYLARKKELDGRRRLIASRDESLGVRVQSRNEEMTEAKVLLGVETVDYQGIVLEHDLDINAQTQENLRREIERVKIRIEDIGGGSGVDVINEFNETRERDEFLEKEIQDISTSIESLESIIAELKETLNGEFEKGVRKINTEFDKFFKLMFGGGKASLEPSLIKKRKKKTDSEGVQAELLPENEEKQEFGIDIRVQLPRKKVSDLDMLSGGERSLTSIALLFALSQVNPPPFLVLDETDAALDEANSQRYGDMVESLSEYSQLIVVTHNRETMSRAQTLFGVTLGRDDCSTALSLRLEDAAKYAK